MEKPQSLTTPQLAAVTNPLFSSHFVKMNAGLTQSTTSRVPEKNCRKFSSLFPTPFCHVQEVKLLIFWVFNPLKIIQLKIFMPYEHLAHAPPASAQTQ